MSHSLHVAHLAQLNSQNRLPSLARILVSLAVVVTKWDMRQKSRRTLLALDPHELDDIGVSPSAALRESEKPFWKD